MKEAHNLAISNYNKALPIMTPPGERVKIPFEGWALYGNLRKPNGVENPPIVIMCMGLDSTKEEMYTNEAPFLERGMATLAFDGPGQGEAEFEMPIRFDYEAPVGAVIDFLEYRNDIDLNNIGLWGITLSNAPPTIYNGQVILSATELKFIFLAVFCAEDKLSL